MNLKETGDDVVRPSRTGGHFLLSGTYCLNRAEHKYFHHRRRSSLRYLILAARKKKMSTWIGPGLRRFVYYTDKNDVVPVRVLKTE